MCRAIGRRITYLWDLKVTLAQLNPLIITFHAIANADNDGLRCALEPLGQRRQPSRHPEEEISIEHVDHGIPLRGGRVARGKRDRQVILPPTGRTEERALLRPEQGCPWILF